MSCINKICLMIIVCLSLAQFGHGIESAKYEVIQNLQNKVEIRKYEPSKWACASMQGSMSSERTFRTQMFRKLFNYISGQNDLKQKIEMTVPVTMQYKSVNGEKINSNSEIQMEMGFYVPAEFNNRTPNPTGDNMHIESESEQTFACVQFGGFASLKDNLKYRDVIIKALGEEADKYDTVNFIAVGYNSPFELFYRRNEIWLRKIK